MKKVILKWYHLWGFICNLARGCSENDRLYPAWFWVACSSILNIGHRFVNKPNQYPHVSKASKIPFYNQNIVTFHQLIRQPKQIWCSSANLFLIITLRAKDKHLQSPNKQTNKRDTIKQKKILPIKQKSHDRLAVKQKDVE